jgi:hypothetical protein
MSGMVGPDARAASMPSVVFDGGIRMSVRTDLGLELLDRRHQLVERARGADQLDLVGRLEQRRGPLPHEVVILREDHAHHARIVPSSERQAA